MTLEERIEQALSYFSGQPHPHSFVLLEGAGKVMFSAPHAVLQTRRGRIKCAERFTGMLCLLLHEDLGAAVIYKSRHLDDDANHDPVSDYRDALCRHVQTAGIQYVFDLHQLAPERPMDVCVCTGKGANLAGKDFLVKTVVDCFENQGFGPVTLDDPFHAASPHTVSSTVAAQCGIPAIQLEINTRLLLMDRPEYRFADMLAALGALSHTLNVPDAKEALPNA